MSDDVLLVTRDDDNIVTLTFNRPEKLNAFTKSLWGQLGSSITELSRDDSVRCIVLRGAGERAFSPGNDISEFETDRSSAALAEAYGELMHGTIAAIRECPVPLVAMIHGICVGGGLEIAGLCDIRICGASSRFGAPISRLGLVMAHAELSALISLCGRSTAMEILLEGQIYNADWALARGLVSAVVADADVEDEAMASARRIAAGAPLVHRWHKQFARRLQSDETLTAEEKREGFACYDTSDFAEGYRAFLEKRKPEFRGE